MKKGRLTHLNRTTRRYFDRPSQFGGVLRGGQPLHCEEKGVRLAGPLEKHERGKTGPIRGGKEPSTKSTKKKEMTLHGGGKVTLSTIAFHGVKRGAWSRGGPK